MQHTAPISASTWSHLRRRGLAHWTVVLVLITAGTLIGHWVSQRQIWIDVRYAVYQRTFDFTHPHGSLYPKRTALVLVQDEEYWKGDLAGRAPIKRDYLARLIRKLDAADVAVVAVDFDLRSPVPDGSLVEHPDYLPETEQLREAVKDVGSRRPVVLPAILGFDAEGNYQEQSTVLRGSDFGTADVRSGYIQLPYDLRRVPVAVELNDGKPLDSFAGAIVAAADSTAHARLARQAQDALPFGSYMNEAAFSSRGPEPTVFSAGDVLQEDVPLLRRQLGHKIVIISGAWSANGYHSGPRADVHLTPAGLLPGAFIHANFLEALLSDRTYKPVGEGAVIAFDVLLVLVAAATMALPLAAWLKAGVITTLGILFAALSYFLIQNLGLFFDFFVPVVVLAGHLAVDKVLQWRHQAHARVEGGSSAAAEREPAVD
jgi:CHASE2 domain-containing sensor protein